MSFNKTVVIAVAVFVVLFDVVFATAVTIAYLYGGC